MHLTLQPITRTKESSKLSKGQLAKQLKLNFFYKHLSKTFDEQV